MRKMRRIGLTAIITFWAIASITLVGCGEVPQSGQIAHESSRLQHPKAEEPVDDGKSAQSSITCRATFMAYEKDYRWFDHGEFGDDDGMSPLASFVLVEPVTYAGRTVNILFKYAADTGAAWPPDPTDIGCQFTFEVATDFLSRQHEMIDNASVRRCRKTEQE